MSSNLQELLITGLIIVIILFILRFLLNSLLTCSNNNYDVIIMQATPIISGFTSKKEGLWNSGNYMSRLKKPTIVKKPKIINPIIKPIINPIINPIIKPIINQAQLKTYPGVLSTTTPSGQPVNVYKTIPELVKPAVEIAIQPSMSLEACDAVNKLAGLLVSDDYGKTKHSITEQFGTGTMLNLASDITGFDLEDKPLCTKSVDCGLINGKYGYLKLENDGNLVLYSSDGNRQIWTTGVAGGSNGPYIFILHSDGNMVIYDKDGNPTWSPHTDYLAIGPYYLVLKTNGNVILYGSGDRIIWQTNTAGLIGSVPNPNYNASSWNCSNNNFASSVYPDTHGLYTIDSLGNLYQGDLYKIDAKGNKDYKSSNIWWPFKTPTKLSNISYKNDNLWGVDTTNNVYNMTPSGLVKKDGILKQVSVGCNAANIWGLSPDGNVMKQNSNGWDKIDSEPMSYIESGADSSGDLWGISKDNKLWYKNQVGWSNKTTPVPFSKISSNCMGDVWGIDVNGQVYKVSSEGNIWNRVGNTALTNIRVGKKSIYGTDLSGNAVMCSKPCSGTWSRMGYAPNPFSQI